MADPDYFLLTELRALPQMSDTTKYTEARCLAAAAYITSIIERECDASFVPRAVTETHDGSGTVYLELGARYVMAATAATVSGTVVTDTLAVKNGFLYRYTTGATAPSIWPLGFQNVEVDYLAGYTDTPPDDVKEAALKGTRAYLLSTASNSAMDDRRTSLNTEQGTIQYVVAGPDRPTGYPEVDAVILAYKRRLNAGVVC